MLWFQHLFFDRQLPPYGSQKQFPKGQVNHSSLHCENKEPMVLFIIKLLLCTLLNISILLPLFCSLSFPPLNTLHLVRGTSVWRQSGAWLCRLEQVEEHIVAQLMMRVSALSLGEDASCCFTLAHSTHTPRETDFQTYAVCFFNPVEHFNPQQTRITLRDIHILWQGGGRSASEQFSFLMWFFFFPPKLLNVLTTQVNSLVVYGFANFFVCLFYTKLPSAFKSCDAAWSNLNSAWCTCCHFLFQLNLQDKRLLFIPTYLNSSIHARI